MLLCGSLNILWHCPSLGLEWKLTFSSSVASAVFQICWHIECSILTAWSFRICKKLSSYLFLLNKSPQNLKWWFKMISVFFATSLWVNNVGWLVLKLPLPRIAAAFVWQVIWGGSLRRPHWQLAGPCYLQQNRTSARAQFSLGVGGDHTWAWPPGGIIHWRAMDTVDHLPPFLPSGKIPKLVSINIWLWCHSEMVI